ncbi:MAG: hypothetical protein IPP53_11895 [Bacteroidetes bacterium]|nr:hypothetical protein [Bacteroidota bacterium]
MKKLFLSSIVLLLFSISNMLFQVSCQKEANANPNNITQLNKIVYIKEIDGSPERSELWISDIDGNNQTKIPVTFPFEPSFLSISLTTDGSKVIFSIESDLSENGYIYSCKTDGSNLTKLVENTATEKALYYSVNAY